MNTQTLFPDSDRMDNALPSAPRTRAECGLSEAYLCDLITKHLYRYGVLSGHELAAKICLPFLIIETMLEYLLKETYLEKRGGNGLGNSTDRYGLTDRGRNYARDILELDTYTGPAPVPLDQYQSYIKQHNLSSISVTHQQLRDCWSDFIIDDQQLNQLGPAICSGKSCFLYGPPGTGKTTLAKKIAYYFDHYGGHVAIPHALLVGGSVIRLFDPVHHEHVIQHQSDEADQIIRPTSSDQRWVLCKRPAVIVGGELSLDMLDLRYNPTTKYYEAPLQLKANGGVFIIDDFGRQLVKPRMLLNRWIIPLEERIDYLTLHTGKKFAIPFEQLVIFATNLEPNELADEAFLRRIRYKIFIGEPTLEIYLHIFMHECNKKGLHINTDQLETIISQGYANHQRPLRACDPRDITDQIYNYCTFHQHSYFITDEILRQSIDQYLSDSILTTQSQSSQ